MVRQAVQTCTDICMLEKRPGELGGVPHLNLAVCERKRHQCTWIKVEKSRLVRSDEEAVSQSDSLHLMQPQ